MGRPIEKRYIGVGTNKIKCRVKIGTGSGGSGNYAEADGGIIRQRGSKRFRVGITYTFTATIASGILTVTVAPSSLPTGFPASPIAVGTIITGTDTPGAVFQTVVTALGTGTGGAGTYSIANSSITLSSAGTIRALDVTRSAVCKLVTTADGSLGANEMSIAVKNDAGTVVGASKMYSRVAIVGGVKTRWTFDNSASDNKVEVEKAADSFVVP